MKMNNIVFVVVVGGSAVLIILALRRILLGMDDNYTLEWFIVFKMLFTILLFSYIRFIKKPKNLPEDEDIINDKLQNENPDKTDNTKPSKNIDTEEHKYNLGSESINLP